MIIIQLRRIIINAYKSTKIAQIVSYVISLTSVFLTALKKGRIKCILSPLKSVFFRKFGSELACKASGWRVPSRNYLEEDKPAEEVYAQ